MKKVAVFAAKVVAWVVIMVIGCVGAYAAIMDLVHLHPAWQWPLFESGFVVFSVACTLLMFKRKVVGYALIAAMLIIWCIPFASVWIQGELLNNAVAVVCALLGIGFACVSYNEHRS